MCVGGGGVTTEMQGIRNGFSLFMKFGVPPPRGSGPEVKQLKDLTKVGLTGVEYTIKLKCVPGNSNPNKKWCEQV